MDKIPFFKKSDIIIIGICLLLALVFFVPSLFTAKDNLTAVITADGEIVKEIRLGETTDEKIQVGEVVIIAKGKEVYFSQSDCPDKTCIKTGKLDAAGESSACVPNRVSVVIKGEKAENGVDIIVY